MKVESKQHQILRPATEVYTVISRFSNFTPILASKVEGWEADDDTCSFMAKGFHLSLAITERQENRLIKIGAGPGGTPFPFTFWVQLKEETPTDTRMRIILDAELNMMMKMMIGSKLQEAVDKIAEQITNSFNKTIDND